MKKLTRRDFLKTSAVSAIGVPYGWTETIKKNLALMIMHAPSVAPGAEYPQYRFDMLPYLEEVSHCTN
jgi:hypothetical protein